MVKSLKQSNYAWYYIDNDENSVHCRSSWEVLFANYLKHSDFTTSFEYEPEEFQTPHGSYTPDFKVVDATGYTEYIEIKGFEWDQNQVRKRDFLTTINRLDIVMIDKQEMQRIGALRQTLEKSKREAARMDISLETYLAEGYYLWT